MSLLWSCHEPNQIIMTIPDNKPPLLKHQKGLNPELNQEQVVFEKHINTLDGTEVAYKVYNTGDLFEINMHHSKNLYKDDIAWKKTGMINQNDLKEMERLSKTSVVDYINSGTKTESANALEDVMWYFYFDNPVFTETQLQKWQWKWWKTPSFIKKIDHILEKSLIIH